MSSDKRTAPLLPGSHLTEATLASAESETPLRSREAMWVNDRDEKLHATEQLVSLSEMIANLENIYALPDNGVFKRRSPLPSWYPRRPLQDITAVINSIQVIAQEAAASKKVVKKGHSGKACCQIHDGRGARVYKPRVPRVPTKSSSLISSGFTRGATLRQGFR